MIHLAPAMSRAEFLVYPEEFEQLQHMVEESLMSGEGVEPIIDVLEHAIARWNAIGIYRRCDISRPPVGSQDMYSYDESDFRGRPSRRSWMFRSQRRSSW